MFSEIGAALGIVKRPLEKLWERLISPLAVDVRSFCYQCVTSDPGDSLVIITPHPRRYRAELRVRNRTSRVVIVEDIWAAIDEGSVYRPTSWEKTRLDPHDYCDLNMTFPVEQPGLAIESGTFELHIKPTVGRETCVTGVFPT